MKNKMMKTFAMIFMAGMMTASLAGCGANDKETVDVSATEVEASAVETENEAGSLDAEVVETEVETEIEEVDRSKATYSENDIAFVLDDEKYYDKSLVDGEMVLMSELNPKGIEVKLTKSVSIFNRSKEGIGYTKENIMVRWEKESTDWCVISYQDDNFYLVKAEEFNKAVEVEKTEENVTEEEAETVKKEETPSKEESKPAPEPEPAPTPETPVAAPEPTPESTPEPAVPETIAPKPVPETPAPSYSDGEVIGIVESTLRGAGLVKTTDEMTQEEIKKWGVTAGMGWVEFNVSTSNPQVDANGVLEFYSVEGYNMYYLESVGTVSGGVTIRAYYGTY